LFGKSNKGNIPTYARTSNCNKKFLIKCNLSSKNALYVQKENTEGDIEMLKTISLLLVTLLLFSTVASAQSATSTQTTQQQTVIEDETSTLLRNLLANTTNPQIRAKIETIIKNRTTLANLRQKLSVRIDVLHKLVVQTPVGEDDEVLEEAVDEAKDVIEKFDESASLREDKENRMLSKIERVRQRSSNSDDDNDNDNAVRKNRNNQSGNVRAEKRERTLENRLDNVLRIQQRRNNRLNRLLVRTNRLIVTLQ